MVSGDDSQGAGWSIRLVAPNREFGEAFDAALEDIAVAVTLLERKGGSGFDFIAHCLAAPDPAIIESRLADVAAAAGVKAPLPTIEAVPETDWVSAYQNSVGPQSIGRFFVYPSHFEGGAPDGMLPIRLDAGMAFGTGEHETTRGCLLLLDRLEQDGFRPGEILDLGCGSAILAIGAARLWPDARIIAADNDPEAVATADENLERNDCESLVETALSDFFNGDILREASPYALIVANILAGPLIDHAGSLVANLKPHGRLVLSGLLTTQADAVIAAHAAYDARVVDRTELGDWTTLLLSKA